MIESFWFRMQVELLDRKRWNMRIELSNAVFEYLEIWHNRKRRHSQLGGLTPIEFERTSSDIITDLRANVAVQPPEVAARIRQRTAPVV